jgi:uncharacterized protein (TIGR02147 family)
MTTVYEHQDYKGFLKTVIQENQGVKGFRSQLAKGARCQKSFLSQVLNSHVQLTPDHAAAISAFLNFDEQEADYFLGLVEFARAGSEALRNLIQTRLKTHQNRHDDISRKWAQEELKDTEAQMIYYSTWYMSAIHVLVSIPGFDSVRKVSARLGISEDIVQMALRDLQKIGLVKKIENKWKVGEKSIHLAKHSPMTEAHHSNWRHRALLDCQLRRSWSVHFSSVFAISKKDADRLRKQVLDFLIESRKNIAQSPEEEIYVLNADLFPI